MSSMGQSHKRVQKCSLNVAISFSSVGEGGVSDFRGRELHIIKNFVLRTQKSKQSKKAREGRWEARHTRAPLRLTTLRPRAPLGPWPSSHSTRDPNPELAVSSPAVTVSKIYDTIWCVARSWEKDLLVANLFLWEIKCTSCWVWHLDSPSIFANLEKMRLLISILKFQKSGSK